MDDHDLLQIFKDGSTVSTDYAVRLVYEAGFKDGVQSELAKTQKPKPTPSPKPTSTGTATHVPLHGTTGTSTATSTATSTHTLTSQTPGPAPSLGPSAPGLDPASKKVK